MKRWSYLLIPLSLSLFAAGCGGGGSSSPGPSAGAYEGGYSGSFIVKPQNIDGTIEFLVSANGTISGEMTVTGSSLPYIVTGNVNSSGAITFTQTATDNAVIGSGTGTLTAPIVNQPSGTVIGTIAYTSGEDSGSTNRFSVTETPG